MRKIVKKFFPFLLLAFLLISPYALDVHGAETVVTDTTTLNDLRAALEDLKTNKVQKEKEKAEADKRVAEYQVQITASIDKMDKYGEEIAAAKQKIAELEIEIQEKEQEIKDLLTFLQLTNGENVYLEYVFGAQTFTDFIFRTAIVEQLSTHNDELIDEMNMLIEENKKLQEELAIKIEEEKKAQENFNKMLAAAKLTVKDIETYSLSIDEQIEEAQSYLTLVEGTGCSGNSYVYTCVYDMIMSEAWEYIKNFYDEAIFESLAIDTLTIPTRTGVITSEYGYRNDPISGGRKLHAGIDIGIREGNPVYASQLGIVSNIVNRASCGGNIVYIQHNIKGEKITTRYLHLLSYTVKVGDVVTPKTLIGYSGGGSTATRNGGYDKCTTGAHLHFEVRKGWGSSVATNPRNYIVFPSRW